MQLYKSQPKEIREEIDFFKEVHNRLTCFWVGLSFIERLGRRCSKWAGLPWPGMLVGACRPD